MADDPRRSRLRENLERCREAIAAAAARSGRNPDSVKLLPVTKYVEAPVVRLLHELGERDFAERTVQRGDALAKELADLEGVRWHLVGHLQRNKVARALEIFASIHSLDSLRLAQEIGARARSSGHGLPDLYVEVNIGGEARKTGLPVEEVRNLLSALVRIFPSAGGVPPVAGLMTMAPLPPAGASAGEAARPFFRRLRELRDELVAEGLLASGAGLSMGMSGDFEAAVEEGATVVRVGSMLYEGI
jgi:pyridoxal phosphate enzyme (YggS family)